MSTAPSSSDPPAIELSGVAKHFGSLAALRDVTVRLEPGHFYSIVGDNGAGKSTLLRIIAGLMQPSRGTVSVFGTAPRAAANRIGYMPHASMLYDELSGMENLRYFAGLYGIRDDAPCEAAMRTVGLDPQLARRVGQYSQGMRQRLSLARATLHGPSVLLLDEPFSNVDASSAQHMVHVLAKRRDAGNTVLVVTHQPALLESTADDVLLLRDGSIHHGGTEARRNTASSLREGALR